MHKKSRRWCIIIHAQNETKPKRPPPEVLTVFFLAVVSVRSGKASRKPGGKIRATGTR